MTISKWGGSGVSVREVGSAKFLEVHVKGASYGNFASGINFDGARLSMDFYIRYDSPIEHFLKVIAMNDVTGSPASFMSFDGAGGIRSKGASKFTIEHYGEKVWQNASWGLTHISGDQWDVDLTLTNLDSNAQRTETQSVALGASLLDQYYTTIKVMTSGKALGGTYYRTYLDNIEVRGTSPVPIPAAVWLFGSAMAGLGFITRKRKGVVAA